MLLLSLFERNLNEINKCLFGKEYDNDKNIKLSKIKEFQRVLAEFVKKHEKTVSVDDIEEFINAQKQNLIEIGVEDLLLRLLQTFSYIYKPNDLDSINNFLGLIYKSKQVTKLTSISSEFIYYTKCYVYKNYVKSQSCDNNLFKKIVDDLLSCNYLDIKTFIQFIDKCFSQDKDKNLTKRDCFRYIFDLLKKRFAEGKNISNIEQLPDVICRFGIDVVKNADQSIFQYMLNLTRDVSTWNSESKNFYNWFEVFSSFKAEFWDKVDLKDKCWIVQYTSFLMTTLNFLSDGSSKRQKFYLYDYLNKQDILDKIKEVYKTAVLDFIKNEYILPETKLMIMLFCAKLYITDTQFLRKILGSNGINEFLSIYEKVKLDTSHIPSTVIDCLSVYSTQGMSNFIKSDIKQNDSLRLKSIWNSVLKRCKDEKSKTKITDFFPTPNDLFDFYKKVYPEFLEADVSKIRKYDIAYGDHKSLYDCLKKYNDKEIVDLIGKSDEAHESLFIWHVIHERCENEKSQTKITDFFTTPNDLFNFYKKAHPHFLENIFLRIKGSDIVDKDYLDLYDCLQKYSDKEIANFIGKSNESHESLFIWHVIHRRCEDKESKTKITDFFATPKDLFNFYKKAHPEFLVTDVSRTDIVYGDHKSLYDCLQKYSNEEIVNFIKESNEPHELLFIWTLSIDSSRNAKNVKNKDQFSFQEPRCFIDFYINKVPNKAKNSSDFNIFLYMSSMCNDQKLWQNYFESISQQRPEHIQLFRDFFDGKIDFSGMNNWTRITLKHFCNDRKMKYCKSMNTSFEDIDDWMQITMLDSIFSNFTDLKSFLDFYMAVYSNSNEDLLEQKNSKRKTILVAMIKNREWDLTDSLLKMCDKKYDFCVPILIDKIANEFLILSLSDLVRVVQFLSKKNDLDQDLKSKLLNKIDVQIESSMESLGVDYEDRPSDQYKSDAFRYPHDFKTNLKYVIEIMNSNDVLPETKKKIYDWVKQDLEKDQKQWEYVLEMYVYNIEKDKKPKKPIDLSKPSLVPAFVFVPLLNLKEQILNNSNENDKNNKYERLQYYGIGEHKGLTTLNSHQGEWYLADLKNSNELNDLENQITTNQKQIDNLNEQIVQIRNNLRATEFKFEWNWNLFVWLSGIGTIVRFVQRRLLNQNLLAKQNQIDPLAHQNQTRESQRKTLENKIEKNCNKKKADYEDSLSKAKEAMKKWGKCENSTDYPHDKHEEYCAGLRQIIDIYERQYTKIHDNKSSNLIPLQNKNLIITDKKI